jgi:hypothetical protein
MEGGEVLSKRHQSSRRRAYGRRQHELRERTERVQPTDDMAFGAQGAEVDPDGFSFTEVDVSGRRLSYVLGD